MTPLLLTFILCALPATAALQAGVAHTDITPKESIWLGGYASRTHRSEAVRQHIFAKALALRDDRGSTVILVTADLLGFTAALSDDIAARVQKQFGISRDRIAFNASHTHSAPVLENALHPTYPLDTEDEAIIHRYTMWMKDQVVDLIGRALTDLAPAQISFNQGLAGVAVNRRRVGHRDYPGPVDQDVPVLAIRTPGGALRAIVFGYSCHNTVLSDYQVSGDWAGYAEEQLEKDNPGATALFVQGCGADANPLPRGTVDFATTYGHTVALAAGEALRGKMKPLDGEIRATYALIDLPFQKPDRADYQAKLKEPPGMNHRYAQLMLQKLEHDGSLPDHHSYPVQAWQLGNLTFLTLGGEVVVDYALRFRRQFGFDNLWVAGYTNDVFAYIPTLRVLQEGGYEGGGAMIPYAQPAPFTPAVEELIAQKVDELVRLCRTGL
jgi:neutral ceramidase